MVRDITMVMMTMDRSPRSNYLPQTLKNLASQGVLDSDRLHSLHLVDSGSCNDWPEPALQGIPRDHIVLHVPSARRVACINAATALDAGLSTQTPWILFCEDDLDFCADFLDGVGRWLDLYGDSTFHVFPFGAAYPQVHVRAKAGHHDWKYPVSAFYGTQCFAIHRRDAKSLSAYWHSNPPIEDVYSPSAYDLMLQQWHRQCFPEQPYLLASAPSFVQHIGRDSIATGKKVTHEFTSWPGRQWSFEVGALRA